MARGENVLSVQVITSTGNPVYQHGVLYVAWVFVLVDVSESFIHMDRKSKQLNFEILFM